MLYTRTSTFRTSSIINILAEGFNDRCTKCQCFVQLMLDSHPNLVLRSGIRFYEFCMSEQTRFFINSNKICLLRMPILKSFLGCSATERRLPDNLQLRIFLHQHNASNYSKLSIQLSFSNSFTPLWRFLPIYRICTNFCGLLFCEFRFHKKKDLHISFSEKYSFGVAISTHNRFLSTVCLIPFTNPFAF